MPIENQSDLDDGDRGRELGRKNFDLIIAAAVTVAVLIFIAGSWPASSERSGQASAIAGMKNAALAGFNYETSEGLRYYKAKDYARAEEAFRKSIEYSPDDAVGYNNLGSVLNDQQKWDEAIRVLRRALELDYNLALARNNLAWAESHKAQENAAGK